jgi:hypothetical protein
VAVLTVRGALRRLPHVQLPAQPPNILTVLLNNARLRTGRTCLFVWIHVDVALDAFLPHVGPAVPRHPFPLALWTLILPETPLLTLVGS